MRPVARVRGMVQSLCKSLGDSVHVHPIKNMGLWLRKFATPPTIPLTAWREMTLAEQRAIIVLLYLRYSCAAISLITGQPWSTVRSFVARATDCQSVENHPCSGRPCILTRWQRRSIIRVVKEDRQMTWAELRDMYAPNVSLSTIDRYLPPDQL